MSARIPLIERDSGFPEGTTPSDGGTSNYCLVNKYMRKLLVVHFSKRVVLLNCLLVKVSSIALVDILDALSPSLKDPFQFFSRNRPQNCVGLFE
jgi:hypothetical protein